MKKKKRCRAAKGTFTPCVDESDKFKFTFPPQHKQSIFDELKECREAMGKLRDNNADLRLQCAKLSSALKQSVALNKELRQKNTWFKHCVKSWKKEEKINNEWIRELIIQVEKLEKKIKKADKLNKNK